MSMVVYEVEESVATVRLNRPEKLNAFTYEMIDAIRAAVDRAAADDRVVGIVITGAGRGFSAGLDAADLARSAEAGPPPSASAQGDDLPALFSYLVRVPKPVIAAVNGVAAGGGFVLAMMCDLRFASEDASFTTIFSRRGLVAEHGTSWILPRLVGTSRALDLLWSARRIDAAEAFRIGFVDRLVSREHLLAEAAGYVRDLGTNCSRRALAVMKAQVYRHVAVPFDVACHETARLVLEALAHPDATEGAAALLERRPPRFAPWKREDA